MRQPTAMHCAAKTFHQGIVPENALPCQGLPSFDTKNRRHFAADGVLHDLNRRGCVHDTDAFRTALRLSEEPLPQPRMILDITILDAVGGSAAPLCRLFGR